MHQLDQTIEDLKFCVETLGMNDEEVEEFMNVTSEFGVRPEYYGGDDERPRLSRNFTQFAFDSKSGEEYLYLFVDNEWNGFSLDHKYSEEDWEILDTKVNPVEIPEPEVA